MKLTTLILALLLTNYTFSQKRSNEALYFEVTCGFAAQTSKEILFFKHESNLKDSSTIKKKLITGSELEQVLSAILLLHYNSNYQITLSSHELEKLAEISKSKRRFELCFTCTYQEKGTLRDLFNKRGNFQSYEIIKQYLINKL